MYVYRVWMHGCVDASFRGYCAHSNHALGLGSRLRALKTLLSCSLAQPCLATLPHRAVLYAAVNQACEDAWVTDGGLLPPVGSGCEHAAARTTSATLPLLLMPRIGGAAAGGVTSAVTTLKRQV